MKLIKTEILTPEEIKARREKIKKARKERKIRNGVGSKKGGRPKRRNAAQIKKKRLREADTRFNIRLRTNNEMWYLKKRKIITDKAVILSKGIELNGHYFYTDKILSELLGYVSGHAIKRWQDEEILPKGQFKLKACENCERVVYLYHFEEIYWLITVIFEPLSNLLRFINFNSLIGMPARKMLAAYFKKLYNKRERQGVEKFNPESLTFDSLPVTMDGKLKKEQLNG